MAYTYNPSTAQIIGNVDTRGLSLSTAMRNALAGGISAADFNKQFGSISGFQPISLARQRPVAAPAPAPVAAPKPAAPAAVAAPVATSYNTAWNTAAKQLNPIFDTQLSTINAQLPAIEQLFEAMSLALAGQQQAESGRAIADANSRGLLYSTVPINQQTAIASDYATQRAELGSRKAAAIGSVNEAINTSNLNRTNAITQLVEALFGTDLKQKEYMKSKEYQTLQFNNAVAQANRGFEIEMEKLNKGIF